MASAFVGILLIPYFCFDLIKFLLHYESMDSFTALAEPNRRKIMEILSAEGEMPASAIYMRFKSSPPAISQHLKALKEANLVRVEKRAQQRIYFVNPEPLKQLEKWIRQFTARTEEQFERLDRVLEREKNRSSKEKKDAEQD